MYFIKSLDYTSDQHDRVFFFVLGRKKSNNEKQSLASSGEGSTFVKINNLNACNFL